MTTPSGVARAFRRAPSLIERAVEGGSGPRVRGLDLLDVRGLDLPEMLSSSIYVTLNDSLGLSPAKSGCRSKGAVSA